jgi:hypothetical protein
VGLAVRWGDEPTAVGGRIARTPPKTHPTLYGLKVLVKKVRQPQPQGEGFGFMYRHVPGDLARRDFRGMTIAGEQVGAFEAALQRLTDDHRFEWLPAKAIDEALWYLACEAKAKPVEASLAEAFVEEYAKEPIAQTCFFAIDGLEVEAEVELFGVRFLPAAAVTMPATVAALTDLVRDSVNSVAAVEVSGTSDIRMAGRGRKAVEHALRVLRFTLRAPRTLRDEALWFRVGRVWWTDGGGHQWKMPKRPLTPVWLRSDLIDLATSQPVAELSASGGRTIDEHARIALDWFERSQLEDDQLSKMLFLFFALEAIVGDRSEGLKGEKLALRRAILSHLTTGKFSHPARAYVLYEEVRNKAVHGSRLTVPVTEDEVLKFSHDVRAGINEFLELARSRGFTKRGELRDALDNDPAHDQLAARLHGENPQLWKGLESSGATRSSR